jgi:hypothetical protein
MSFHVFSVFNAKLVGSTVLNTCGRDTRYARRDGSRHIWKVKARSQGSIAKMKAGPMGVRVKAARSQGSIAKVKAWGCASESRQVPREHCELQTFNWIAWFVIIWFLNKLWILWRLTTPLKVHKKTFVTIININKKEVDFLIQYFTTLMTSFGLCKSSTLVI